jgi:hypothetical protein
VVCARGSSSGWKVDWRVLQTSSEGSSGSSMAARIPRGWPRQPRHHCRGPAPVWWTRVPRPCWPPSMPTPRIATAPVPIRPLFSTPRGPPCRTTLCEGTTTPGDQCPRSCACCRSRPPQEAGPGSAVASILSQRRVLKAFCVSTCTSPLLSPCKGPSKPPQGCV